MALTGVPIIAPVSSSVYQFDTDDIFVQVPSGQDGVFLRTDASQHSGMTVTSGGNGTVGYQLRVGDNTSTPDDNQFVNIQLLNPYRKGLLVDKSAHNQFANLYIDYAAYEAVVFDHGADDNTIVGLTMRSPGNDTNNTYAAVHVVDGDRNQFDNVNLYSTAYHKHSFDLSGGVGNKVGSWRKQNAAKTSEFLETAPWDNDLGEVAHHTVTYPGVAATSTGALRFPIGFAGYILDVLAMLGTAGTGSATTVDVNLNGTTIFSTTGDRPTLATSAVEAQGIPTAYTEFVADDYFTFDVDAVDSNGVASDLSVSLRVVRY